MDKRSSGILLHLTSLPGKEGVGTMGKNAFAWIDFLCETGQTLWQILPLGPPGTGNCPYQCFSAFAGNPLLIDLFLLREEGLLSEPDLQGIPRFDIRKAEYEKISRWKRMLLQKAYTNFRGEQHWKFEGDYARFRDEHNWWLTDYALFMAAHSRFEEVPWQKWPEGLKRRNPEALEEYKRELAGEIAFHEFQQFLFFRQWKSLREYARGKNVRIIGDVPLYISGDSVDVWANTGIFLLDGELNPLKVSGVPPDYFSTTGQRWGTPLFDWESLKQQNYHWWLARIHFNLMMFDQVRIDHFRGLDAFWSIAADHETAVHGEWMKARGHEMLEILRDQLGSFPLIAEDLGTVTPEVEQMRDFFHMPGMKVLQFAFTSDEKNTHLPHNFDVNSVVYTGTHDNDTVWAWFHAAGEPERKRAMEYLSGFNRTPVWAMIELAWASVACKAVAPLQDLLELGAEARMNIPGIGPGNWEWRFRWDQIKAKHRKFLKEITRKYNRE